MTVTTAQYYLLPALAAKVDDSHAQIEPTPHLATKILPTKIR